MNFFLLVSATCLEKLCYSADKTEFINWWNAQNGGNKRLVTFVHLLLRPLQSRVDSCIAPMHFSATSCFKINLKVTG